MVSVLRARISSQLTVLLALVVGDDERNGLIQIRLGKEDVAGALGGHDHPRHHEVAVPFRELLRPSALAIDGYKRQGDAHLPRQAVRELDIEADQAARPC